jgi:hypothetical protein
LPLGPDPVHLFAENFDVEMWNSDRIMEIDGKYQRAAFCVAGGNANLSFNFIWPMRMIFNVQVYMCIIFL